LASFVSQRRHTVGAAEFAFCHDIQPELCLVGLFLDNAQLRQELLSRSRAASGSVVRPNRRACSEQLAADDVSTPASGQVIHQADDSQRKGPGAILQVDLSHDLTLPFRIPNSAFRICAFSFRLPRS
jgi:hypothetical protein